MLITFLETLRTLYTIFLDWVFPPKADIAALERMSPGAFAAQATAVCDPLPAGIYSVFKYKDPLVRRALWALKYAGNKKVAELFARLVYESMLEPLSEAELFENFTNPILIPLPLSQERFKERGWNQAEMLGRELIKLDQKCKMRTDMLLKIKHTAPQTKLSRKGRLKNLAGCFAVDPYKKSEIVGRNIILLDDVTTTGSTIIEARTTLLTAGARAVLAFTVAH